MPDQLPLYEIPLDPELGDRLRAAADARVRARIDTAQANAQNRRAARAQFAQARRHGLQARRAARARRTTIPTPSQRGPSQRDVPESGRTATFQGGAPGQPSQDNT